MLLRPALRLDALHRRRYCRAQRRSERAAGRALGASVGRGLHLPTMVASSSPSWPALEKNYSGWTAWMLTPDLKLPGKMRLKESRRGAVCGTAPSDAACSASTWSGTPCANARTKAEGGGAQLCRLS